MSNLIKWFTNSKRRQKLLTVISGLLIAGALLADYGMGAMDLRSVLMVLAAVAAGFDVALRAMRGLLNRNVNIELLVTIAAAGAILIGEYWEAAAVEFLFQLGAWLESRTMSRTRQTLRELLDLAPDTAIVLRNGEQTEIRAREVEKDETVVIKPGAKVPVDGKVLDGHSAVDESSITGEPLPAQKQSGEEVYAGTINQTGWLKVKAIQTGSDTTLARIIKRVEEAQEEKAPTQRFIERFARWYTPSIIGFSVLAYLVTWNIELALTLLVIGCPGALVISTPISVISGIGRAAKDGILIKGGEYLENAGKINAVTLDKTGTLTRGKPRLTDIVVFDEVPSLEPAGVNGEEPVRSNTSAGSPWEASQQHLLYWAGMAETHSEHPLASPIVEAAQETGIIPEPDRFESVTGKGIRAQYNSYQVWAGNQTFMEENSTELSSVALDTIRQLKEKGKTTVLVAINGRLSGVLGISDTTRPDAPGMIHQLKEAGIERVLMLTGDERETAEAIGRETGIDEVHAELLPEDKLDKIRDLRQQGYITAMIGDGINDAPALATADIGIAMGAAGTDVAIESADIALMADDLLKIPRAISLSRKTLNNIRQNVVIALLTVAGLLTGVITDHVHMAGGMFIHEISVLVVILNGMRLLRA